MSINGKTKTMIIDSMAEIGMLIAISSIIVFLWTIWSSRNSALISWPVFGTLPTLVWNISRVHDAMTEILLQNGGTFTSSGLWFTNRNLVITSDPMNVNHILCTNFANYVKGDEYREILELVGEGILAADSDAWRTQRRILHSLFRIERFKESVERILSRKVSNGLFPILENASKSGDVVDLQEIMERLTFDNICRLITGFDPKCLTVEFPEVAINKAFHELEEGIVYRYVVPPIIWKLQRFLQIGKEKTLHTSWKFFYNFVLQHVVTKRQRGSRFETDDFDVLSYFLFEAEEDGGDMKSDEFLTGMALNLLVAGRDTIAAALVWFFWAVGKHPSVEEKIYEEMKEKLPREENGGKLAKFSFEEVDKLSYLHAVICEVLRLYPTIPFDHMMSIEEDVLPSGLKIPRNKKILYVPYAMGRMEAIWGKDCLEFKPERWISKNGEIVYVPSYKFIAFNTGPRSCLGKKLTFIQMKAIVTAFMWNYSFEVVKKNPAKPSLTLFLYMEGGLDIRVSKRQICLKN